MHSHRLWCSTAEAMLVYVILCIYTHTRCISTAVMHNAQCTELSRMSKNVKVSTHLQKQDATHGGQVLESLRFVRCNSVNVCCA